MSCKAIARCLVRLLLELEFLGVIFRGSGSDVFARTNSKAGLVRGFA